MSAVADGDTAWVLACTALVWFMTPGLGYFYSGLMGKKQVVHTFMLSYVTILLVTVYWVLFGYTWSFGGGNGGYGGFEFVAIRNVGKEPKVEYSPTIPHLAYMVYQMSFAIITPAIISGAVAGRIKIISWMIFLLAWCTIVYNLVAHWVWAQYTEIGADGLPRLRAGWLRELGLLDWAGGTVVHITSGFSALALAIVTGKRADYDEKKAIRPSNVPMTLLGASILWFGWFGFNSGSAFAANGNAANAFVATQLAAAMASFTWMMLEFIVSRKSFSAVGASIGAVVGLVVITPSAGFIDPIFALPIGLIGSCCSFLVFKLKDKFVFVEDTLDVFVCHGVGGVSGTLLTGLFASAVINPVGNDGAFFGRPILLAYQLCGVVVVAAVSFVFSFILALLLRISIGLKSDESQGKFGGVEMQVQAFEQPDKSRSRSDSSSSQGTPASKPSTTNHPSLEKLASPMPRPLSV